MERERTTTTAWGIRQTTTGKASQIRSWPHFLGFNDAYDHIECCKKTSRAYQPTIEAMKMATFGFTLDDQADIWFRMLAEDIVTDFNMASKISWQNLPDKGTNGTWSTNSSRLNKRQRKLSRDYIRRTKSSHSRCNIGDKMLNDKLMSWFINGLYLTL